jgi:hypothetical protein
MKKKKIKQVVVKGPVVFQKFLIWKGRKKLKPCANRCKWGT